MPKVKLGWSVTAPTVLIEVSDDEEKMLRDVKNKGAPPCDLDDLPPSLAARVADAIQDAVFDSPVEIDWVE